MFTRQIMKWTKRTRLFAAMITISSVFVLTQFLLNATNQDLFHYEPAILADRFINEATRRAIYSCQNNILHLHQPSRCNGTPFILVLVASAPNHLAQRNLLRSYLTTDYHSSSYKEGALWRIVFLISRTNNWHLELRIKEEIATYQDILHGR